MSTKVLIDEETFTRVGASEVARHAGSLRKSKSAECGNNPLTSPDKSYGEDEVEFAFAIDAYKRRTGRLYPSNHEILGVLLSLGYQKVGLSA